MPASLGAVIAAAITLVSQRALAGSPEAPDAPDAVSLKIEAVAHFDKGLALYDKGAWEAALAEFVEARTLSRLRNAVYQTGLCLEKLGRHGEALEQLDAVLKEFGATMPAQVKEGVERKVAELRALVGEIVVGGAEPGATITVDGRPRGEHPLRVAAGSHLVRISRSGFEPFEARVTVAAGQTERLAARLTPLAPVARLAPLAAATQDDRATATTARPLHDEASAGGTTAAPSSGQLVAGIVAGSVGLVGIGVGSAFGVMAFGKKSDSAPHCPAGNRCDDTGFQLRTDSRTDGDVSTALFVVGGAALVAGVTMIATASRAGAQLTIGPRSVAIRGAF